MTYQPISCSACSWPLPPEFWNRDSAARCPGCGTQVQVLVFPALARAGAGASPEALGEESEASCFYHPRNRAAVPCDECGRFLCRLCELDVDGRHLCPGCFAAGVRGRMIRETDTRRTMYDSLALALATLPAIFIWPALVTAPVALYFVIRHWKSPRSILPRTRVRFVLAALFALAELAGIAAIIVAIVRTLPFLRS